MSDASISFSFKRRIMSPMIQLDTSLAAAPSSIQDSKRSVSVLSSVMILMSYSGSPNCSL